MKLRNGTMSTTRRLNAAMARLAVFVFAFVLAALLPATSIAGVWDDCVLWYNGGAVDANGDGKFTNGEMLDIRHAGIPGSPTHGGTLMNSTDAYDTVLIETKEVVFPLQNSRKLQCPVLNFTAPAVTNGDITAGGDITVYGNIIQIPNVLSTDDDTYTALIRFRREEHHAWTNSFQSVMEIGRNYTNKRGLGLCLSTIPSNNYLQLGIEGDSNRNSLLSFSSGKDGWYEVAVIANGTSLTVGIVETNINSSAKAVMQWKTISVAANALKPYEAKLKLGGMNTVTTTGTSPGKTLFRGQIHMVSLWDRVLSTNEVLEAFSSAPSLFQVGFPNVDGGEVFAGAAGTASITAQPEDWRNFPVSFSRDNPVSISFLLDSTQTDLPQIVRLVPRTGASGSVSVSVNGVDCGTESVRGGVDSYVYVQATCLRTGVNVCTIVRADAGLGALGFNAVQMAGSWRIGKIDDNWTEMESAGNTVEDYYIEMSRCWRRFRRVSCSTHPLNVHLGDVLGRWGNNRYIYTWRVRKNPDASAEKATMVVKLNGSVVNVKSVDLTVECPVPLTDTAWHTYTLELDESNLVRGADNVLRWDSDSSDTTWYGFDYHELTVRKPRKGFVLTFR